MLDDPFKYGLLAALAIALLVAAFTDLRSRHIANWLNAGIALGAPLFWWANGMELWPDIAIQFGVALGTFAILAVLFALRAMGGGDVKLLTALALWIPPALFMQLILLMAVLGGLLTIGFGAWHVMRRQRERLAIPYGVAIAAAGLWVLGTHYFSAPVATGTLG
ncbi:prepilin peptidase CpaA [Altererythrobacter atlanticus]|uniref:Type IV leader peptidase family protein n=1 Tax=Croceibacterium atlanticum TaxID=1267766 RepID=A0A0F7KUJ1_9SPHN|nr:prepilin peptidase [Croceibacterium atlanticum]AKH42445.1 Type IV leader peptidase family protein [Croceibacterium atlanticum]MBB5731222.1 prepilin peptidase CpaA [Croceibacterium atlanticum]